MFPQFSAGHRNLSMYPRPKCLLRERQHSCLHRIMCDLRSTFGVSILWKHSCAFLLMVLFLQSIITDWQDEKKRTKKLGSQIWENLCSLYSNKCLASEKFVLASGSNLSLATGLASWKVSLEPWISWEYFDFPKNNVNLYSCKLWITETQWKCCFRSKEIENIHGNNVILIFTVWHTFAKYAWMMQGHEETIQKLLIL